MKDAANATSDETAKPGKLMEASEEEELVSSPPNSFPVSDQPDLKPDDKDSAASIRRSSRKRKAVDTEARHLEKNIQNRKASRKKKIKSVSRVNVKLSKGPKTKTTSKGPKVKAKRLTKGKRSMSSLSIGSASTAHSLKNKKPEGKSMAGTGAITPKKPRKRQTTKNIESLKKEMLQKFTKIVKDNSTLSFEDSFFAFTSTNSSLTKLVTAITEQIVLPDVAGQSVSQYLDVEKLLRREFEVIKEKQLHSLHIKLPAREKYEIKEYIKFSLRKNPRVSVTTIHKSIIQQRSFKARTKYQKQVNPSESAEVLVGVPAKSSIQVKTEGPSDQQGQMNPSSPTLQAETLELQGSVKSEAQEEALRGPETLEMAMERRALEILSAYDADVVRRLLTELLHEVKQDQKQWRIPKSTFSQFILEVLSHNSSVEFQLLLQAVPAQFPSVSVVHEDHKVELEAGLKSPEEALQEAQKTQEVSVDFFRRSFKHWKSKVQVALKKGEDPRLLLEAEKNKLKRATGRKSIGSCPSLPGSEAPQLQHGSPLKQEEGASYSVEFLTGLNANEQRGTSNRAEEGDLSTEGTVEEKDEEEAEGEMYNTLSIVE